MDRGYDRDRDYRDYRRRGSPPDRRGGYDDRDRERDGRGGGRGYTDEYDRGGRRGGGGYSDRRRSYDEPRDRDRDRGGRDSGRMRIKSFKEFVMDEPADVDPAEYVARYAQYKAGFADQLREQWFDEHRHEEWMRDRFDPARLAEKLEARNTEAKERAEAVRLEAESGELDVGVAFGGGGGSADDGASGGAEQQEAKVARAAAWAPARMEHDLSRCTELMRRMDGEKGIAFDAGETVLDAAVTAHTTEERLDVALVYLWRVHGVDYYGGSQPEGLECATPESRHLRRAEDRAAMEALAGDSDAAAAAEAAFRQWEATVDETWEARLTEGDAAEALVGTKEVEAEVEAWIKDQVTVESEGQKYGCKLSQKKFIAPEFVVKHVRNKHAHRVDEARADARDRLYKRNFLRLGADEVPELQRPAVPPADGPGGGAPPMGGPGMAPMGGGGPFRPGGAPMGGMPPPGMGMPPFGGRGGGRGGRGMGRGMPFGGRGPMPPLMPPPQSSRKLTSYVDLDAGAGNAGMSLDYGAPEDISDFL